VRVYLCITQEHDLRFVLIAALICLFGTYTALSVLHRAMAAEGRAQLGWLGASAIATGGGIWSTHFVAMLAYQPSLPTGYDFELTALSIVVAILVCGLGLAVALAAHRPAQLWFGGGMVGLGVGSMHYTGMAALRVPVSSATTLAWWRFLSCSALDLAASRFAWRSSTGGRLSARSAPRCSQSAYVPCTSLRWGRSS